MGSAPVTIPDGVAIGLIIYILLAVFVSASLPSDLFSEVYTSDIDEELNAQAISYQSATNETIQDDFSIGLVRKMFFSWSLTGVPLFIGAMVTIINIVVSAILIIWGINKVRGI